MRRWWPHVSIPFIALTKIVLDIRAVPIEICFREVQAPDVKGSQGLKILSQFGVITRYAVHILILHRKHPIFVLVDVVIPFSICLYWGCVAVDSKYVDM
jgi:hypothetical protein